MTPACCNCLHYNVKYLECRNPDADCYTKYKRPGHSACLCWEHEKEFETERRDRIWERRARL